MGVIINYPDGTKRYASIGFKPMIISKIEDGPSTANNYTKTWTVNTTVAIWSCATKDETFEHPNCVISHVEVNADSNVYPESPSTLIYEQLKKTLYSYEDDI